MTARKTTIFQSLSVCCPNKLASATPTPRTRSRASWYKQTRTRAPCASSTDTLSTEHAGNRCAFKKSALPPPPQPPPRLHPLHSTFYPLDLMYTILHQENNSGVENEPRRDGDVNMKRPFIKMSILTWASAHGQQTSIICLGY